jgi:hypothetical protein
MAVQNGSDSTHDKETAEEKKARVIKQRLGALCSTRLFARMAPGKERE